MSLARKRTTAPSPIPGPHRLLGYLCDLITHARLFSKLINHFGFN